MEKPGRLIAPRFLVVGFGILILIGTGILTLPWSGASRTLTFIEALFMSTSAICVTGLAVVDIGTDLSGFGQCVILLLIQFGGLGMLIWSGSVALMLGNNLGLKEKLRLQSMMSRVKLSKLENLVKGSIIFTFGVELVGAILLWLLWMPQEGVWRSFQLATFHSVSAFCNAGFSLWPDSLSSHATNPLVNLVVIALFVLGGIGFLLFFEVGDAWKRKTRLSLHARLSLGVTGLLLALGTLFFLGLEYNNPKTIQGLSPVSKIVVSFFQSATTRTAGFNTIPIGDCESPTRLMIMVLMFVGGCTGSTAGGLKTTTLAVIGVATWNYLKGRRGTQVGQRRIPNERVTQSMAILCLFIGFIWLGVFALSGSGGFTLDDILFETISAVATVGLSTGITSQLSTFQMLVVCALMFAGRVGPLTLAVALLSKTKSRLNYIKEDVGVG